MNAPATIKSNDLSPKEIFFYTAGTVIAAGGGFFLVRYVVRKTAEKRVEKRSSEEGSPESYVKALKMAFENDGWPGTNMIEVRRVFSEIPTKDFLEKVKRKYQERYHTPLMSDLSDELQSTEYNEMLSIIAAKSDKSGSKAPSYNYLAWAKRLKAAFDKTYGFLPGTDEAAIKLVFNEIPTQADFLKVADAYQKEYQSSLIDDLKGELEFWEYSDYMKIITSKPQSYALIVKK